MWSIPDSVALGCRWPPSHFLVAARFHTLENLPPEIIYVNQLAVFDEYTRHEETAIFRVTKSVVVNKIKK